MGLLKKVGKGIKRYMNNKIESCKEILLDAKNRLVLGLITVGLGIGLVASAYITVRK